MNKLFLAISLIALVSYLYLGTQKKTPDYQEYELEENENRVVIQADSYFFKCDNRFYCSQMTSEKEARFFLKNCPSAKIEIDSEGIICNGYF